MVSSHERMCLNYVGDECRLVCSGKTTLLEALLGEVKVDHADELQLVQPIAYMPQVRDIVVVAAVS